MLTTFMIAVAILVLMYIVTGVKTATYTVPALQPGQYPYLCTVHPTMTGTATVQ